MTLLKLLITSLINIKVQILLFIFIVIVLSTGFSVDDWLKGRPRHKAMKKYLNTIHYKHSWVRKTRLAVRAHYLRRWWGRLTYHRPWHDIFGYSEDPMRHRMTPGDKIFFTSSFLSGFAFIFWYCFFWLLECIEKYCF